MPASDAQVRGAAHAVRAEALHGAVPRGQDPTAGGRDQGSPGRFGKLFPDLRPAKLDLPTLDELVDRLREFSVSYLYGRREILATDKKSPGSFPAGFTYFGQFVDHDITFDPTPATEQVKDPHALADFRTPRFDLDSLYGTGPDDQPYLYDDDYDVPGTMLLTDPIAGGTHRDLPRNRLGRALIGDPRNDEHRIISQLHLLFIRFHNAVVTYLREEVQVPEIELFAKARETVRWHYQWIVTHEYLELVVGRHTAHSVLVPGEPGKPPTVRLEHYPTEGRPFMPLEFSAAAFRFGHSLVRDEYIVNDDFGSPLPIVDAEPSPHSLTGERWLIEDVVIQWKHFFVLPAEDGDAVEPQPAFQINPVLSMPLFDLPHHRGPLARLNLERGHKVGLPSGQDVACALGHDKLSDAALHLDDGFTEATRACIRQAAPLWYYVLCEANQPPASGARLGPVGGTIVAEVLIGLLVGDPASYIHQTPAWTPHLGPTPHDFTMADLVRIAQGDIEPGSVQNYPGG